MDPLCCAGLLEAVVDEVGCVEWILELGVGGGVVCRGICQRCS